MGDTCGGLAGASEASSVIEAGTDEPLGFFLDDRLPAGLSELPLTGERETSVDLRRVCYDLGQVYYDLGQVYCDLGQVCYDLRRVCYDLRRVCYDLWQVRYDLWQVRYAAQELASPDGPSPDEAPRRTLRPFS